MNFENIYKSGGIKKVLVAPLDWGLGHATRCIPIIHELLKQNIKVYLAGDGAIKILLENEFSSVIYLPLQGYNIRYSKSSRQFFLKLTLQTPHILSVIRHEKKWLKFIIQEHGIDAVISDNRFGLYNKNVKSVYITHQLFIQAGNHFINMLAQKIHYNFIKRYDECWVPDAEGLPNLAGKLSHPAKMPTVPVKYLGPLSRFKKETAEKNISLLILLSGPEPQRTIFENILIAQLKNIKGPIVFVRGLPAATTNFFCENSEVTFYNHLPAAGLGNVIQRSQKIVARCGYSTVMDLALLQSNAVLVPTPGQTEQEYLAAYLHGKNLFYTAAQKNFSLQQVIEISANKPYKKVEFNSPLEKVVKDFIAGR